MTKITLKLIIIFIFSLQISNLFAQADDLMNVCTKHLQYPYISDGQQYKALVKNQEIAEFQATFYGGSTYRIVACSGLADRNLIFTLYDSDHNQLYTNSEYKNSPYWDFKFESTVECFIEAQLDPEGPKSGFAIILIGFKQN